MVKREYCKTCRKSVRYADGVLKTGVYQMGQGSKKPLLSFCSKKCKRKYEVKSKGVNKK